MTVVFPEAPAQGGTWRCQVRGTEAPPSDKNLLQGLIFPPVTVSISLIPAHLHSYVPVSQPIYSWSF